MKQTAVNWLLEHMYMMGTIKWNDVIEKAKEMEKEQLNTARLEGIELANKGYGKAE